MRLTVEFFGVARHLTGVEECQLEFEEGADLHDVVMELGHRFPVLVEEKLIENERELAPSFALSINGRRVAQNLDVRLVDNDRLLLISAVWGG